MWAKLAGCVVLVAVCWDIKSVFYALWRPLAPLVAYIDPRRPGTDALHEWFFRSGLDRYVWIHGMVCAYLHPRFNAALTAIDEARPARRRAMRTALIGGEAGVEGGEWGGVQQSRGAADWQAAGMWLP
jgi:hypothetical protein